MSSVEITQSRRHLEHNRRMIIGRSLASALAGAVPIPLLEEWLSATVERATVKRIAQNHLVDMNDAAIRAIADGPNRPPEWTELAGGGIAFRLLGSMWRRILLAALAARRAQAASRAFSVATLFDHYCAKLHIGVGLDAIDGAKVRALIDQAISETQGGLTRTLFRKGLLAAAKATVKAPTQMLNAISGGALTKLLDSGEVIAVSELDRELDRALAEENSFLARASRAIEFQLAAESLPYLERLIDNFEAGYRRQADANRKPPNPWASRTTPNENDDEQ